MAGFEVITEARKGSTQLTATTLYRQSAALGSGSARFGKLRLPICDDY